jgi:beta-glucanase (GH16 family)
MVNVTGKLAAGATACLFLLTITYAAGGWKLIWSDEFDSTALNEANWSVEQNNNPPNAEQEKYTSGHDVPGANVFVKNGHLILEARNAGGTITSGKIKSSGKKTFMYGHMEASMRIPIGQGMWPAFWMMGVGGGWPTCGEIDIMEGMGKYPNLAVGSFHSAQGTPVVTNNYMIHTGTLNDAFHPYVIEWNTDSICWICDNFKYLTLRKSEHPGIPLDKQYYFLLNLAVGGAFGGNIDATTVFPDSLIVDYVRVFQWDAGMSAEPASPATYRHPVVLHAGARSFSVGLPAEQRFSLDVTSVNGVRTLLRQGVGKTITVSTTAFAPGVYVVTVRAGNLTLTDRIAVRR